MSVNIFSTIQGIEHLLRCNPIEKSQGIRSIENKISQLRKQIFEGNKTKEIECNRALEKIATLKDKVGVGRLNNLLTKLEDTIHCRIFFALVKEDQAEQRCIERELCSVSDVEFRRNILKNYLERGDQEAELVHNMLPNISIRQHVAIPKLINYLKFRDPNLDDKKIKKGLCYGLTLLYSYYQFIGKVDHFYDRIRKIMSLEIGASDELCHKKYHELSDDEKELEHFCNDVFYLHCDFVPGMDQIFPEQTLRFVSEKDSIKKITCQLQFVSIFSYSPKTQSYDQLERVLTQLLQADCNKQKFFLLSTGSHSIGIFYRENQCFLYDSNFVFQRKGWDLEVKIRQSTIKLLVEKMVEGLHIENAPLALKFQILSNEALNETKKCQEALYNEINPGIDIISYNQSFPLMLAVEMKNVSLVEALIKKEAEVNQINKNGTTPLMMACESGHLEIAKLLISNGADINITIENKRNPLWIACQNGHLEVIEFLISHGADVNIAVNEGITPLWIACQNGHLEVAKLLIRHGADVNIADNEITTPLWIACQNGHLEVIEFLISHGANINIADNKEKTPLWIACQKGHLEVIEFLISHGADINIADNEGTTPFSIACQKGHLEVAKLLISHDVDVKIANNKGATPLLIARYYGHLEIAKLIGSL